MSTSAYIVLFRMDRLDKQHAVEAHLRGSLYENWRFSDGVVVLHTHLSLASLLENVREVLADTGAALTASDLFYACPLARPYIANLPPAALQWLEENLPHTPGAGERY